MNQKKLFLFLSILLLSKVALGQPIAHTNNISLKSVTNAPFEAVKLSFNTADGNLYVIAQNGSIYRVDMGGVRRPGSTTRVQSTTDHGLVDVQGMDISSDGKFFIVGNLKDNQGSNATYTNIGIIKRATIINGNWNWETVATTAPWPISNTDFDHVMNEIVIRPDDKMLYINSGSRTDHGEEQAVWGDGLPQEGLYPDLRETPLTAKILSIPADTTDAYLENDIDSLKEKGFIFAEGTRNSFGLAFDGNGELFSADNAGERDDPGEFNWLQKGKHYGFPWRIGGNDTPMQYPDYNRDEDQLFNAVGRDDLFYNDPDYPTPPEGVDFTEPILNFGPDGINYVDSETGKIINAFEQDTAISSFTGHRSSLGLVFDRDSALTGEYTGDGFVLAFTGGNDPYFLLSTMDDQGEDLLHIELTKSENTYTMTSKRLVSGFYNPIDSEIIGNEIFVLEFGNSWLNNNVTTKIWKVGFGEPVANEFETNGPAEFKLDQNYPNPFNPSTVISFNLSKSGFVELDVFNSLGQKVSSLVKNRMNAKTYEVKFNATNLSSGIYFYTLRVDGAFVNTQKMMLIK
tara:strand:+ start:21502 stop:23214 length:1713 start_codon:yes stop_codon:yes gene_type:complete